VAEKLLQRKTHCVGTLAFTVLWLACVVQLADSGAGVFVAVCGLSAIALATAEVLKGMGNALPLPSEARDGANLNLSWHEARYWLPLLEISSVGVGLRIEVSGRFLPSDLCF